MAYKALLIGCGNIGAGYDFDNDSVLTHAKAFSLDPEISFEVSDHNTELAQKVAAKYNVNIAGELTPEYFKNFDIVSICTPTVTHFNYLENCMAANVPLVICEKPVSLDAAELEQLASKYQTGKSNILVNYIRRFQPGFIGLRDKIEAINKDEQLTNINIRYQRGFINNCSHAFDLVEFLTKQSISIENKIISNRIYDAFPTDPTLTLTGNWGTANFVATGLSNAKFSFFEIDLFFEYHRISIREAGNVIEISKAEQAENFFRPLQKLSEEKDCLKDYMKHVLIEAKRVLKGEKEDNFISGVNLASKMLTYLQ